MLTRLIDVFVDRPVVGIGAAARVLAVQDALVMAGLDPALQLGGTQRTERMRAFERVEDLEDPVERAACFLVFLGLHQELVEVHLLHVAAARHLEMHAHGRVGILNRQESGAIGRQLALPEPLEQRDPNRQERDPRQER